MTDIQVLYEGPIVNRADAKRDGLKRYFTGIPCKHGHVSERTTSNMVCCECSRLHCEEYRNARRIDPVYENEIVSYYSGDLLKRSDAILDGNPYYFTGKPCKRGHIDKRYTKNSTCRQCDKEKSARYVKQNKDKIRERSRQYYLNNKDRIYQRCKDYIARNPEKVSTFARNRRSRIAMSDGSHTADDVKNILTMQNNKCAEPTCQKDITVGYHVDHIMPLALGGSNWPSNLQCLCESCNKRKSAKHPLDWAKENGRLL